MLKFSLPVLLLQLVWGANATCSNEVIATERVTDLQNLVGDWSIAYIWNDVMTLSSAAKSFCIKSSISQVTQAEVDTMKVVCQNNVDFDWNNVKLKLSTPLLPSRLIASDGTYAYILEFCLKVAKVEVRKTANGDIMITYPDLNNFTELLTKEVPTKADLVCLAGNVDAMKSKSGFPLCYT